VILPRGEFASRLRRDPQHLGETSRHALLGDVSRDSGAGEVRGTGAAESRHIQGRSSVAQRFKLRARLVLIDAFAAAAVNGCDDQARRSGSGYGSGRSSTASTTL